MQDRSFDSIFKLAHRNCLNSIEWLFYLYCYLFYLFCLLCF